MNNRTMNLLLLITTILIAHSTAARLTATSYSHAASSWNSNAHRRPRFHRRRAADSRYNAPHSEAPPADVDWETVLTSGESFASDQEEKTVLRGVAPESERDGRIALASARAALVAIVSAAAIGCARHAVELACL
ncbi:hypothetical protein ACHAW6_015409 [Cyclotella cf. meneghiniana]